MSTTMQGVKALGKALRVKIRVVDAMPAEMQALLLPERRAQCAKTSTDGRATTLSSLLRWSNEAAAQGISEQQETSADADRERDQGGFSF